MGWDLAGNIRGPAGSGGFVELAANFTTALSLTLVDVPGFSFPLAANEVRSFEGVIVFSTTLTTSGVKIALIGPAIGTGTAVYLLETQLTDSTFTVVTVRQWATAHAATASVGVINTTYIARIKGVVRNGPTAGVVKVQVAPEIATATATIYAGSSLTYT